MEVTAAAARDAGLVRPLVCPTSAEKLPFRGVSSAMAAAAALRPPPARPRPRPPPRPRSPPPGLALPPLRSLSPARPGTTAARPGPTRPGAAGLGSAPDADPTQPRARGRRSPRPPRSVWNPQQSRARQARAPGRRRGGLVWGAGSRSAAPDLPQPGRAAMPTRGSHSRAHAASGTNVRGRRGGRRGAGTGPRPGSDATAATGRAAPRGGGGSGHGAHHHQPVPAAGNFPRPAGRLPAVLPLSWPAGRSGSPGESVHRLRWSPWPRSQFRGVWGGGNKVVEVTGGQSKWSGCEPVCVSDTLLTSFGKCVSQGFVHTACERSSTAQT